ncbi:magnesium-translocating P-type ATPase [Spiroplasma platyhelix]|uniref:Magnesium-transporting ATPase, P-type 1 n=1 Tax=Spiroplasma platyhelix PALS-1 TaxID=1276218 RepID=A0A846TRL0_9MOLU|nr:magnesium-translocating P-type ATPase [Spiroplasma platyhelix]MBE4703772.1 Magnesium-transporting ATPase, P-type 1 [Spiroplasma platyhelix PALS-1]NKE38145.1 magnesium-translocating P-type ATPase [Spiroplasma platyhelix PALS-1]UJB29030.1 Mg(2+) transport ATPase, P-type [Spiroplasma platyhelix PALS-1]
MLLKKKKKDVAKNTNFFKEISQASQTEAITKLESSLAGLRRSEVEDKEKIYGKNVFARKGFIWYKRLFANIANPFVIILFIIFIYNLISYFVINANNADERISDLWSAIIVIVMIVLSVGISYFQDFRSYKSSEKLRELVETTASVFRFSKKNPEYKANLKDLNSVSKYTKEILIEELVPGDIIFLSSGDMVPADVRILSSVDLFINQASLTGEALPVEKHAKYSPVNPKRVSNILEFQNLCFMGTSVVSGGAIALVVATGTSSYFGTIASSITAKRPTTSFNKGIKKTSYILVGFMAVIVPIIFIVNAFMKHDALAALIFSISVAVSLTPEMLPMIVSANLARGAVRLSKKKVIVKNLSSMQNFGAMDILCTDKTGTLTEDKIELVKHLDAKGKESEKVLEMAYLNSFFQTGLKNNIDKTIIEHIKSRHDKIIGMPYTKIDEIPFDFARRRMSVVVAKDKATDTLITKGAVEEILKICQDVEIDGKIVPLDKAIKENVLALSKELNAEGLRVIAIGSRDYKHTNHVYKIKDESKLTLLGYIGFFDVPKKSAISAIKTLKSHGVDVKILTGDNEIVTRAICNKVGLDPKTPLLGTEIDSMSDKKLRELAVNTTIFAKMNPLQKARIIDILKLKGHTVGFLGDGINDAVALHHADVSISVNSATDIAKEASDIILLEKDLDVLEQGVVGGRITFGNILKYIKITISSNFGNALSLLVASFWLPFFPMVAIQILLQNLLYDISQLSIPWDNVDQEFIAKPQKWNSKSIIPFALWNGPLSSIFDITTFLFMGYAFNVFDHFNDPYYLGLFQAGWFIVGITTQTLIFHLLRTPKIPFIQSIASWPVLIVTGLITVIGIAIPFTPLGHNIGFVNLSGIYFAYLAGVVVLYFILSQLWKMLYIKITKSWI